MKKLIYTLLETNIDNILMSDRAKSLLTLLAEIAGLLQNPIIQALFLIPLGIAAIKYWLRPDKQATSLTQVSNDPDPTWISVQIAARRTMYQTASLAARARRRNSPKR